MRKEITIPNYHVYTLKTNGTVLTKKQEKHFFNCFSKISRNNDKFVYRGNKKEKLYPEYGLEVDVSNRQFQERLYILGAKANMFLMESFNENTININQTDNDVFSCIFKMLSNLLGRENPFRHIWRVIGDFKNRETNLTDFFCNPDNEQIFINTINELTQQEKIIIRDYYLGLLHHISKSEYYPSSFLLSTSTEFSQAYKFAWSKEKENSENPIIIFGWVPNKYEGVLKVLDTRNLVKKINMEAIGLPVYKNSFFPFQKEVTLKGGLLPHYQLGYLHNDNGDLVFEINPALFETNDSWDGIELPVNQSTFHEYIQNTMFGRYFSLDEETNQFEQHEL
ncbi:TPA: hypothetical protein ACGZ9Q_002738 [Elizabethkingia anophelis]